MFAKEVRDKQSMDRTVETFRTHKGDELYWQWLLEFIAQAQHWGLKKDQCLMAGQEKGFDMAAKNEQKILECLGRIEREVGIDKDELEQRINKALGKKAVVNTDELGFELATAVTETAIESVDDIRKTLCNPSVTILLEYIALLLWIVTKEAAVVLPKTSIQCTIDQAHDLTFFLLEDSGFGSFKSKIFGGYFDEKTFEEYICDRFKVYYHVKHFYSSMKDDSLSHEENAALSEASEAAVAMKFIECCFSGQAEYHRLFPNPEDRRSHTAYVLDHYGRFADKVMRVLSTSC